MTEPKIYAEVFIDDVAFEKLHSMINDRSIDVVFIRRRSATVDPSEVSAIRLESSGVRSWTSEVLKGPRP